MLESKRLEININEVNRQISQIQRLNLPSEKKNEILQALVTERTEYRLAQTRAKQLEKFK